MRRLSITIPATPRNSRGSRATKKQALDLIKGQTNSAKVLRGLIEKMDKGLQQSIAEKEIGEHFHQKFREAVAKKAKAGTNSKQRLTKARVITTEEVIRLKEAREKADAEKEAKRGRGRGKKKNGSVAKPAEEKSDEEAGTWENIQNYDSDSYVPTRQLRSGRK